MCQRRILIYFWNSDYYFKLTFSAWPNYRIQGNTIFPKFTNISSWQNLKLQIELQL